MHVQVLQHISCETLGGLEQAFEESGVTYEYLELYNGIEVPPHVESNALVVLGGPMNVYEEDEYPFLKDENALIQEALRMGIPILGICLGAQLIAKASGARVTQGKHKEIGWYDLNLTPAGRKSSIFKGFPSQVKVFEWHGDTFEIPVRGTKLASSVLFPNQSFQVSNAFALQFHLEVNAEMVTTWMNTYVSELDSIDYVDAKQIWEETARYIDNLNKLALRFYGNFLNVLGIRLPKK